MCSESGGVGHGLEILPGNDRLHQDLEIGDVHKTLSVSCRNRAPACEEDKHIGPVIGTRVH